MLAAFLLLRVTGAAVKEPTDVFGAERIVDRFDLWTQSVRAGIAQDILKWMKVRMAYPFEIRSAEAWNMPTTLPRLAYASNSKAGLALAIGQGANRYAILCLMAFCALATRALCADIRIFAKDQTGRPIEGAIVWAEVARAKMPSPVKAEIVLKNRQFIPPVTVIPVGSVVRFPNRDNVRHHV
jgi:hypothetical protein